MIPGLNPAQNEAVVYGGHSLVVAIPGSGKTRVLQEKTVYILKNDPSAIVVACTFTRDAADEVRSRILAAYPDAEKRLVVGTFHSLCLLQLKSSSKKVKLVSEAEQRHMLKQALTNVDMRISFSDAQQVIDFFKSRNPNDHKSEPGYPLYLAYQDVLERHQAMDFSDILLDTVSGMKDGTVPPLKCNYLLVDEFQDTDSVQLEWVLSHIEKSGGKLSCTTVGDDDQSIYSWRNANGYSGMLTFQKKTGAKLITLDTNYRSKSEILYFAYNLIKHNQNRISKQLKSFRGPGGFVSLRGCESVEQEVELIVQAVAVDTSNWAVLARTNSHLDLVEAELSKAEIPYSRNASGSFWSLDSVHTFTSLLESLSNNSEVGVEKSLLLCGLRRKQLEELKHSGNICDILNSISPTTPRLTVEQKENFTLFSDRFKKWTGMLKTKNYGMVMLGIMQWISSCTKMKERDIDNVKKAHEILFSKTGSLLQRLSAINQLNTKDGNSEGVQLITLHSSKGLEFSKVWMLHANEETMPHKDSLENIEEERCLFYVGMTRAKDELFISYSSGEGDEISRFIKESGLEIKE